MSRDRMATERQKARLKRKQEGVVGFTLTAPADGKPLLVAAAKLMLSGVAPQTAMRRVVGAEEPAERPPGYKPWRDEDFEQALREPMPWWRRLLPAQTGRLAPRSRGQSKRTKTR